MLSEAQVLKRDSNIMAIKWKFFVYRAIIYFSFLFIPVWIPKSLELNLPLQSLLLMFYILFMAGQWFLLGKEIDHRLKIYYKANSTVDRVLYRLLTGMVVLVFFFNLLSFFPGKWTNNLFWTTWVVLGLFYSWPTRGKIIQESVSSHFSEFNYLDSFEKTLVGMILILYVLSFPNIAPALSQKDFSGILDPGGRSIPILWDFLKVNYYPFFKYTSLYKLAIIGHFYHVGMGVFLLAFYGLMRFFVSRRLALLGVFSILTSWAFSKILANDFWASLFTTFSVIWMWSFLWVVKSESYKTGLFLGMITILGTLVRPPFFLTSIGMMAFVYLFSFKHKNSWFKLQFLKYCLPGVLFSMGILVWFYDGVLEINPLIDSFLTRLFWAVEGKAFFSLSILGILFLFHRLFLGKTKDLNQPQFSKSSLKILFSGLFLLFGFGVLIEQDFMTKFGLIWPLALLSVIPLEILFQKMSRLRSKRNIVYLIYILICLLDSHFEGRVKIFLRLFEGSV